MSLKTRVVGTPAHVLSDIFSPVRGYFLAFPLSMLEGSSFL
jgi:hypothetical protein